MMEGYTAASAVFAEVFFKRVSGFTTVCSIIVYFAVVVWLKYF